MMEMSKAISEKTSGRLETNVQTVYMGGVKIGHGVDSRNLRPSEKTEVGIPTTKLGTAPGRNKDLSSRSSNVWTSKNYSGDGCLDWDTQNRQFYHEYAYKGHPYTSNFDYSGIWFRGNMNPKSPEAIGSECFFANQN